MADFFDEMMGATPKMPHDPNLQFDEVVRYDPDELKQKLLERLRTKHGFTSKYAPRPSSAGRCVREQVYSALGFEQGPIPDAVLMNFADGEMHEAAILEALRDVSASEEWDLWAPDAQDWDSLMLIFPDIYGKKTRGRVDAELRTPGKKTIVVEIKSASPDSFKYVERTGPDFKHKLQLNLYLYHKKLPYGLIIYKNKGNGELAIFGHDYSPNLTAYVFDQFVIAGKYASVAKDFVENGQWKNGERRDDLLPNRPFHRLSPMSPCKFCSFHDECWASYADIENKVRSDDPQLLDWVRAFFVMDGAYKSFSEEKDTLRTKIIDTMTANQTHYMVVGDYELKISVTKKTGSVRLSVGKLKG